MTHRSKNIQANFIFYFFFPVILKKVLDHFFFHQFIVPSMLSFIHSSICLFIHSTSNTFTYLTIQPFIQAAILPLIHSSTHPFFHSFIYPFYCCLLLSLSRFFIHSSIHSSFSHSPNHSSTEPFFHSFIQSANNPFIHPFCHPTTPSPPFLHSLNQPPFPSPTHSPIHSLAHAARPEFSRLIRSSFVLSSPH